MSRRSDASRRWLSTSRSAGRRLAVFRFCGTGLLCLLPFATPISAQDLDPRAYARVPVNATFLVTGISISHGAVVSDATLPVTGLDATVETPSVGFARSFDLFGKTAQAFAALPYSWAKVSGDVLGDATSLSRAGLSDMHIRLSVLMRGAPAASLLEMAKAPRRTILGASVTVVAPTGQFFPDKVINLGTNRWKVKPEFAVSKPIGQRWLLDTYAGVWLFGTNDSFYPGASERSQAPIGAFQAHISYTFGRKLWAAFDATSYIGGRTTVNGIEGDDRQSNSRIGATLVVAVGQRHSVKFAVSKGAITRHGLDFSTFSIGWQTGWVPSPKVRP